MVDPLLAEVFANPDDLALRQVLADRLVEKGDPRGELIQLQCLDAPAVAQQRRIRALERAHGVEWLGALGPVLHRVVFRHGFVARGRVKACGEARLRKAVASPEWRTITELDVSSLGAAEIGVVAQATFPRLRVLDGLRLAPLGALLRAVPAPRLEALACVATVIVKNANPPIPSTATNVLPDLLASADALPSLRHLTFGGWLMPELSAFLSSPLARRLSSLTLPDLRRLSAWIEAALAAPWLRELGVREDADVCGKPTGWHVQLARGDDERFSVGHAHHGEFLASPLGATLDRLAEALAQVPEDLFTSLSVDGRHLRECSPPLLRQALDRQSRLRAEDRRPKAIKHW